MDKAYECNRYRKVLASAQTYLGTKELIMKMKSVSFIPPSMESWLWAGKIFSHASSLA